MSSMLSGGAATARTRAGNPAVFIPGDAGANGWRLTGRDGAVVLLSERDMLATLRGRMEKVFPSADEEAGVQ